MTEPDSTDDLPYDPHYSSGYLAFGPEPEWSKRLTRRRNKNPTDAFGLPRTPEIDLTARKIGACTPCVTPGYGAPGIAHCAACCSGSGVEEYDPNCPIPEHRTLAELQFGPPRATA